MKVLVINAGSSSLKYQLLNPESGVLLAQDPDLRFELNLQLGNSEVCAFSLR